DSDLPALRDGRHGQARRMHDVRRPVAENGMELILTRGCETGVAALLEADELLVAVIPAPRPLIDVAADSALIADLRRADVARRFDERRIQLRDLRVLGEIDDFHRGADLQAALGSL